jgi:uncharacterized membrane protein YgcG
VCVAAAEQVLLLLWRAHPDVAAKSPMPYRGRVAELLEGDPYLVCVQQQGSRRGSSSSGDDGGGGASSSGGSALGVKLKVVEVKTRLNF